MVYILFENRIGLEIVMCWCRCRHILV